MRIKRLLFLVGLPILLALIITLAQTLITYNSFAPFYLQATITAPANSPQGDFCQLFFDLGDGIRESDSICLRVIANQPVPIRFQLPDRPIRSLRLDPTISPGTVIIKDLRITQASHDHTVRSFQNGSLQPISDVANMTWNANTLTLTATGTDCSLNLGPPHLETFSRWKALPKTAILRSVALPIALVAAIFLILAFAPLLWRINALHRLTAKIVQWSIAHPQSTIIYISLLATLLSCYPVVFLGRSFVAPNNGGLPLMYNFPPLLPGLTSTHIANTGGADVGATMWQCIPYAVIEHNALFVDHELPLWNRFASCGIPLLGQGLSMSADPLHWLVILADSRAWAWDIQFLLERFLLCLAMGLLALALTRHLGAAAIVAASTAFMGLYFYSINHPVFFASCTAPWILLPPVRIMLAPTFRARSLWALVFILAINSHLNCGVVKESAMVLLCAAIAVSFLFAFNWTRLPAPRAALLTLLAAATLALLIDAPTLTTFLRDMPRAWTIYEKPTSQPYPLSGMLALFDGSILKIGPRLPSLNFLFLLGVLWALARLHILFRDRLFLALFAASLVPFAFTFGIVPYSVVVALPFIKNISHTGSTFITVLIPFVGLLAAFGFADFFRNLHMPRRAFAATLLRVVTLLLALLYYHFASNPLNPRSGLFVYFGISLILAVPLLPPLLRALAQHSSPTIAVVVIVLTIALHFHHSLHHTLLPLGDFSFEPEARANLLVPSPAVTWLQTNRPEPARAVGLDQFLMSGFRAVPGLEGPDGPDPLMNRNYRNLVAPAGMEPVPGSWLLASSAQNILATLRVRDMLNIRYYFGRPPQSLPLPLIHRSDLDIFENPNAWPGAFFSPSVSTYATVADLLDRLRTGNGAPFAAVQQSDTDARARTKDLPATPALTIPASNYRLTANTTTFTLTAPCPGIAVLTETYIPEDFRVLLNGQPTPYFRVNHAFKAVLIPAPGTYTISFQYWPKYLTAALVASAAALLISLLWLLQVLQILPTRAKFHPPAA